ncbi:MAG: protein-L-isoaspartate O-methyltransferase [Gallionellales bacterium 35-53-114]|jgi:protein-L-isoaspartate(D-aspartate) O-methyltransferase|nr:MAG: protein-L-isoaspartate O-methyltransferase [Gallionellales bacterium 35-53-114]OYZ63483.1 MAG: protein-L-isoaspartate O-methyltransferase [Gallionellales bacterium 24-53-125]OZB10904.1 MAG: protein-L-isoaspartate O-methyltransferase [Gallionellales bacterium 39-52-133]HQS58915.1 protein-L-isoaspartate O-methyltransferase [Gallionellaceae bacterium]HQS75700.1 protein-L-isoaspartate O-methyltransferase [Gallionellaceae bacterium]
MNNMEQARFNMIEQQIRPWDVADVQVLNLLSVVKREQFVPSGRQSLAFMDLEIPLGFGASMWQPKLEARVLHELHIQKGERVLEVGTGSGYLAALLSRLAAQVTSVEIVPELSVQAAQKLNAHGFDNIQLEVGDAAKSWGSGKYDVIVLTGSVPVNPAAYQQQLNLGGRLFAIVGDAPAMQAMVFTRLANDVYECVTLFETNVAPLQNAPQPQRFVF